MATRVARADGADLLVRVKPGCGLVALGVYFPGLPGAETPGTAGISWLLARAALRGAGRFDAEALAAEAERLGGSIVPGVGSETLGWSMVVPPRAAPAAAALLWTVAAEPTLDPDGLAVERRLLGDDAARVRDDMFRYPLQQVLAQAFPGDPYGLPPLGTAESLGRLDAARTGDWAARLQRVRPVVIAVGDADADALAAAVERFARWPGRDGAVPPAAPAWSAGRAAEPRAKAQTALALAFPAPPRAAPERYPLKVLATLLSGLAGRLFDALREQRALAYTVHAQPWLRRRASAFLAYVATGPEREAEARDAMLEELERLTREAVAPEELARARNAAAGLVAIRRQHARSIMIEIGDAWVHGTLEDVEDEEARLRAVDAGALSAAAAAVFRPAARAEYVVRGTAAAPSPGDSSPGSRSAPASSREP